LAKLGFIIFARPDQLDFTGPQQVLALLPGYDAEQLSSVCVGTGQDCCRFAPRPPMLNRSSAGPLVVDCLGMLVGKRRGCRRAILAYRLPSRSCA